MPFGRTDSVVAGVAMPPSRRHRKLSLVGGGGGSQYSGIFHYSEHKMEIYLIVFYCPTPHWAGDILLFYSTLTLLSNISLRPPPPHTHTFPKALHIEPFGVVPNPYRCWF